MDHYFVDGRIAPLGLLRTARLTAQVSLQRYDRTTRPFTLRRLWGFVRPNLQRPVFVVGCPRSGTTFLGTCLGALPELSYHLEPYASIEANEFVANGHWSDAKARWFFRSYARWLMRLHGDGDLVYVEKNAMNALAMGYLRRIYPDARFVHIIRDGRDVVVSMRDRAELGSTVESYFIAPEQRAEYESTHVVRRTAWAWRLLTESARSGGQKLPREQYLELRYETLIAEPDGEIDRLCDFLGIGNAKSRRLGRQAAQRGHPNSIGRWQTELSVEDLATVDAEAGSLLRGLGYTT